jgi:predicted DsbA family dithiol-disulfide isomerase
MMTIHKFASLLMLILLISSWNTLLAQSQSDQAMKSKESTTESEPSKKVRIEIWSDIVCPFCYLGKKKVERAIAALGAEDQVEIIWHSFQLDPNFPQNESHPSSQYLAEVKGYPVDQVRAMCANLAEEGKAYGIDFQFDQALTFNTRDAHQLIQWAKEYDKSHELKGALMKAYFSDGLDLSQQQNLLHVVTELGLNEAEARQVLQSGAYSEQVQVDIARSRQLGIGGVPFFLIDGQQTISGAQPDRIFEREISTALKNRETKPR